MSFKLISNEAREKRSNRGFIKIFAAIACSILAGFIIFSIISTNIRINESKRQYEELLSQTEIVLENNASISRYLEDNADMDQYIEEIAREKLDYANPDERVYYIVPAAGN